MGHAVAPPRFAETRVTREDLSRLSDILKMLSLLNDEFAPAHKLAILINQMPPLKARVTQTYNLMFMGKALPSFQTQVGAIGNRQLETLLLEFLEDLTILRADLLDP